MNATMSAFQIHRRLQQEQQEAERLRQVEEAKKVRNENDSRTQTKHINSDLLAT